MAVNEPIPRAQPEGEVCLHKFIPHKFFIVPYVTMHKGLERRNKNRYQETLFDKVT